MLISFVVVPARILGVKKHKERAKATVGRWTIGGAPGPNRLHSHRFANVVSVLLSGFFDATRWAALSRRAGLGE